jgi:hypothetical protein
LQIIFPKPVRKLRANPEYIDRAKNRSKALVDNLTCDMPRAIKFTFKPTHTFKNVVGTYFTMGMIFQSVKKLKYTHL